MNDYADRICIVCGKTYKPVYPAQICCCNACKRRRKAVRSQEFRARRADLLSLLKRQVVVLKKGIITLHKKMTRPLYIPAANPPEMPACDALSHTRAKTTFKCTCLACGKVFNADRSTQTTCASCMRKFSKNLRHTGV